MVSGPRKTWKPRCVDVENIEHVRPEQMDYVREVERKYRLGWAIHVSEIDGCITKLQHRHGESSRLPPHKVSYEGAEMHKLFKEAEFGSIISTLEKLDAWQYFDERTGVNWASAKKYLADDTAFTFNDPEMGLAVTGSPDYVLHITDGDIYVLIDWKTGSRYMEKHMNQLKRYALLLAGSLRKPISTYLVLVYAPSIETPANGPPRFVTAKSIKSTVFRATPPKTIGDIIMNSDWYLSMLNALVFSRLYQPSLGFECAFCPYIHVCRGYPFGVAPNPEPPRVERAETVIEAGEDG